MLLMLDNLRICNKDKDGDLILLNGIKGEVQLL